MDFKDSIKQIAERVEKLRDNLQTEEATKNALIMPFLNALGYDVFNPMEVLPEMTCDIGTKKGEKIDYAIMRDGNPVILIECKHWQQDLNLHDNQLLRYFNVSTAKFGVLTNGIIYRFYTDLIEQNRMDEKPFLEINMLDLRDTQIEELKKFHKSYFDVDAILSSASELKYAGELKSILIKEFTSPSPEFVKFFGKQIYDGAFTAKIAEQFASIVKRSISAYINDMISDRLKAAIKDNTEEHPATSDVPAVEAQAGEEDRIVTTEEELQGFYIVRSMLYSEIDDINRVAQRDTISYFGILLDDNNRKPICRLHFNGNKKHLETFDAEKKGTKHLIESLNDLYKYHDEIVAACKMY